MSEAPPLRGAIVGFGFISEGGHLPAYRSERSGRGFEIAAVADVCPARRARAKEALPRARIYEDAEALFAAEASRLDFVDLSTPPSEHASLAHAALDRGLHVLCEKPLATSATDARAMLEHAVRAKRVLFPCHNYKHAPVVKAVRRALDSGAIGKPHLVTLQTFRNTHARGVQEWRPDWRRERRWSGGGIAMDHGSHTFYLAFDWLGAYPTTITAKMHASEGFDTEDDFTCAMSFPGGLLASAHLTWRAGVRRVLYTIHGDKGAIRVEDDDVEVATMQSPAGKAGKVRWDVHKESIASEWMDASHAIWFRTLQDQFAEAVAKGDFAGREAQDSLRCIELIATAYASAHEGCRELPLPPGEAR